jgi:hypothetical protein
VRGGISDWHGVGKDRALRRVQWTRKTWKSAEYAKRSKIVSRFGKGYSMLLPIRRPDGTKSWSERNFGPRDFFPFLEEFTFEVNPKPVKPRSRRLEG